MKKLLIEKLYPQLYDRDRQFAINLYFEFTNKNSSSDKPSLKRFMNLINDLSLKRNIIVCCGDSPGLSYELASKVMGDFLDEKVCDRNGWENNGPFSGWLCDNYEFLVLNYNSKAKCEDCIYCKCANVSYKTFYCIACGDRMLGVDYAPKRSPSWCAFKDEAYTIKKDGG